jgi:hypothetical protein
MLNQKRLFLVESDGIKWFAHKDMMVAFVSEIHVHVGHYGWADHTGGKLIIDIIEEIIEDGVIADHYYAKLKENGIMSLDSLVPVGPCKFIDD